MIGGYDSKRWIQFDGSANRIYVSWKLNQLHFSTQMALFTEGTLLNGGSPTENWMGLQRDTTAVAAGVNYQTIKAVDSPGPSLHSARSTGIYKNGNYGNATGFEGDMNIAFADGSVTSYHLKLNSNPFSDIAADRRQRCAIGGGDLRQ